MLRINRIQKIASLNLKPNKSISFNLKSIIAPSNIKFSELDESIEYLKRTQSTGLIPETLREKLSFFNLRQDFQYFDQFIRVGL